MAPEYAIHGHLTDKADIYSFCVVALEIVSGNRNRSCREEQEFYYLVDWVIRNDFNFFHVSSPHFCASFYSKGLNNASTNFLKSNPGLKFEFLSGLCFTREKMSSGAS
jgi:hypothetical protein